MEKSILRSDITEDTYREILDVETHHDHEIIQDEHGTLRWKEEPGVRKIIDSGIDLNILWSLFHHMDYGKNSETIRKLYRDMGYSLSGYWEIFYWEANNEDAENYVPNQLH